MIHESRIVFVAWQCPEPENRGFYPVARLLQLADPPRYEFVYVAGAREAVRHGFVPFFSGGLQAVYRSDELPAFLATRLMSPQRPDYAEHMQSLGLALGAEPISVLARSEGTKVTDNLEVFGHPGFDPTTNSWVYFGFCRGIRHRQSEGAVARLAPGDRLVIDPDPMNSFDPDALLLLRMDSTVLGYVPRTLIEDLNAARNGGHQTAASVERVNPTPVPVQERLLVRFQVAAFHGFRPLSTPRYQPVSQEATIVTPETLMQQC